MTQDSPTVEPGYDLVSRSLLLGRLVTALAPPPGPVLDVGGSEGLTANFLAGRQVIIADVRSQGAHVVASGAALPFHAQTFAVVTALDVLEHVPLAARDALLSEMARVGDTVILASPFDEPAVHAAEDRQRARFEALFGTAHQWLAEHAEMGLPSLRRTREVLERCGLRTAVTGSNPLPVWEADLELATLAVRLGADVKNLDVRRYLTETFLDQADATAPSYRCFVVASRLVDPAAHLRTMPKSDPSAVVSTEQRLRTAAWGLIGTSLDKTYETLASGWAETADLVGVLQQRLGTMTPESTVRDNEELVVATGAWRAALAGPPLLHQPDGRIPVCDTMPTDAEYAAWLAGLPAVPVPPAGPRFSVVVPVYNPAAEHLTECIRSVRAQTYQDWELVLVDVSDAPHVGPITQRFATVDARVRVVRAPNDGIAVNTNRGVDAATGDWIVFLDHDDELAPEALAAIAGTIAEDPDTDFVYSDEDKLGEDGRYRLPSLKPAWSPHLLRTLNYITHLVSVRRELFVAVGGLRAEFPSAQDYDFVLRATSSARRVAHVARILYHWRQHSLSTAADVSVKPEAHGSGRRALQRWADEYLPGSWIAPGPGATAHRIRIPLRDDKVSIIVPFRDQAAMTERCVNGILRYADQLPLELLLVSNRSREPETEEAIRRWQRLPFTRVIRYDEPFNFQRLNNWAVDRLDGELLLFLNNDIEPLHRGWLEALAEYAQQPDVGAVGARLFYPDGTVQHAGVAVGIGGFADHPWARLAPDATTPAGPSYWVRDVTAVTAACLMIRRAVFDAAGRFDERFEVCGGDVDLGIRLRQAGYWNVMTPFARLVHHESVTRDRQPPDNDIQQSLRAYAQLLQEGDPFYNPWLTRCDTSCRLAGAEKPMA